MKSNIKTALIFFALSIILGPQIVFCQTAQQIAQKAFGSTVLLVMEDASGQPLKIGSGFIVRKGIIASNLHVVEGAANGYVKLVGKRKKYDIEGISAVDSQRDLVLLKVAGSLSPALSVGNSEDTQVGESVYAVGNPQGLEGTFSQGIVSSIRNIDGDKLLQITAPISPGSSGGPVLNENGDVIGVSVATFKGGQNLNFAIPSIYLKNLLTKTGAIKPLITIKSSGQGKSIFDGFGGNTTDGVVIESLVWDSKFFIGGEYSFTIKNKLRENIKNIVGLLIFYDLHGEPIDFQMISFENIIPAGFGKRVEGSVSESVKRLSTRPIDSYGGSDQKPDQVEYRILSFEII